MSNNNTNSKKSNTTNNVNDNEWRLRTNNDVVECSSSQVNFDVTQRDNYYNNDNRINSNMVVNDVDSLNNNQQNNERRNSQTDNKNNNENNENYKFCEFLNVWKKLGC